MEKSTCSVITFHEHIHVFFKLKTVCIYKEMSELLDKQVNAQKTLASASSRKSV